MGGLGDHAGEMIYILLAVIFIVAVMITAFTLSKSSKKTTNSKVNELGQQVSNIDNQTFEDFDQGTASGTQIKNFMAQMSANQTDCAVLIGTLSLFGNEPSWGSAITATKTGKETTFNGIALEDSYKSLLPVVQIDLADANDPPKTTTGAFMVNTALKTTVKNPVLINYGSILKNAVTESGTDGEDYKSVLTVGGSGGSQDSTTLECQPFSATTEYAQTIAYKDGRFITKLEFAASKAGRILRYDNTLDWTSSGKTMSIPDAAMFKTYVLQDAAGKYKGIVAIESR